MHRIDSATARQDANGAGKIGFHDNADLPNQDATYFTPEWSNALQEEVAGVIEGLGMALDKTDNGQLLAALVKQFGEKKVLTDAIKEYKRMIEADRLRLDDLETRTYEDTQIGELFWTTQHFATTTEVAMHKGYGTWQRALQGRVAVGFSDIPDDHIDFRTHGKQYGEREHTLTVAQMPSHKHSHSDKYQYYIARHHRGESVSSGDTAELQKEWQLHGQTEAEFASALDEARGDNKPHNNMQPSQTIDCWERVG